MLNFKRTHKSTGIYRTSSPIDHFQIRVILKPVKSLIQIGDLKTNLERPDDDKWEVIDIKWQEKILSSAEVKRFSIKDNCTTDLHKEYHNLIERYHLNDTHNEDRKIFTIISDDECKPTGNILILTEFLVPLSEMNEPLYRLKNRSSSDRNKKCYPVNSSLSLSAVEKKPYNDLYSSDVEYFYVMVDLEPQEILVEIQWFKDEKLLKIYPDFNNIKTNPYLLESDSDQRQIYHYAIELIKQPIRGGKRLGGIEEVTQKLLDLTIHYPPMAFENPRKLHSFVMLNITIQTAIDFEYDKLHVRYLIDLPDSCELIEGELFGSTISSMRNSKGIWNFGHPFSITFSCPDQHSWKDSIRIIYDLKSIDSWGRERDEGFVVDHLIPKDGLSKKQLQCSRWLGSNWLFDSLRRWFIGGIYNIELTSYLLPQSNSETNIKDVCLNRYGNKTISTGRLNVDVDILVQYNSSSAIRLMRDDTVDRVINDYQKAKDRLLDVKKLV